MPGEPTIRGRRQRYTQGSYTWDGVVYTLAHDYENRLTGVTSSTVTASFTYDGDGNRVKSVITQSALTTTTTYIGNYLEWTTNSNGFLYVSKYYYAGGVRVAEFWFDYINLNAVQYWLLSDQLGSTTVTAFEDGSFASELRYMPWGEGHYTSGTTPTSKQYTGQVHEPSLGGAEGLYYYNARFTTPSQDGSRISTLRMG
jgi:YD repeat-containing protein